MARVHDEASSVDAEQGVVIVNGPGGVAVALTPDAALETADRLTERAAEANGQRVEREWEEQDRERRHPK